MAKRPINYTSRDFETIKDDLVNYAKRYYPTTFKDFSEASFGALMIDMVAYVGDQLSFYADYQANESFLDSALEYDNINRLAKILGYKTPGAASSTGQCAFYILVPSDSTARGPDTAYFPILQKGTILSANNNASYTLIDNVDFSDPNNEITVARVDSATGNPTYFAVKAYGQVISGRRYYETVSVGNYVRFRNIKLSRKNVSDVLSVKDIQGNEYFDVDYLTQNIVYQEMENTDSNRIAVPFIIRAIPAPRRFVTEHNTQGETFIQFGYGSAENLTGDLIADPADVVLNVSGRSYMTDATFDPSNLIKSDKFGVVPVNTTLTIEYTANDSTSINAPVGAINTVLNPQLLFQNRGSLSSNVVSTQLGSIEVENETPILGDTSPLMPDEIRTRAFGGFATQMRAVTRNDYITLAYRVPSKFGKIKRCNVVRDALSLKRNLNVYVLSEDASGNLTTPNDTIKENLKVWLNRYRMINDTLDIQSGKVVNIGINFQILPELDINRYDLLNKCIQKIKDEYLNIKFNIGEAVYISQVYKLLNDVPGVVDTTSVELVNLTGGIYSEYSYGILENLSNDGRFLKIPQDTAAEVLLPDTDIVGAII
tara:strand:- start:91 stop:1884 length:1794 start_codon:yes stop_codon:yes gene_type:complete